MIFVLITIIGLVLTYALTLASFAWEDLLTGTILASLLLAIYHRHVMPPPRPKSGYVLHILANVPRLIVLVLLDVLRGTWQVLAIVVGIRPLAHPGVLKIPLANHGRSGVAIVAFLVTLSPGSFVVAIDWEERIMLVHFIDTSNPDKIRDHVERYYALWEYDDTTSAPSEPRRESA